MSKIEKNLKLSNRVIISNVNPEIEGGRFPVKRIIGDDLTVTANIFAEDYCVIACILKYRKIDSFQWHEVNMSPLNHDYWVGKFVPDNIGYYIYTIQAWIDEFLTWRQFLIERKAEKQDISIYHLKIFAEIISRSSLSASPPDSKKLNQAASILRFCESSNLNELISFVISDELMQLMIKYSHPHLSTSYKELPLIIDRKKAQFSTWYQIFPRSCTIDIKRHGTFKDCENYLPYIASMGFDVLYLPPIHPIGNISRRGKNNSPIASSNDPGCPWAIGSENGGHKAIHPKLGNLEDFINFVNKAKQYGLEIALDIAFHCSPDHPYIKQHPEWFQKWEDKLIPYSESFPNRYEDVYPINFSTYNWEELWIELKSILIFWINLGVHIFRVDNPHTKPFAFWEWIISEIKRDFPFVLFLAEAFTRPTLMYHLSKIGFTQSFTYFTWRNTSWELIEYFTTLTQPDIKQYFLPNLWPNTHDILPYYLKSGGKPAFKIRLVLAATLSSNYGIYGPAYELCENHGLGDDSEEYFNSEKYEIKKWNIEDSESIKDFITLVNRIRHENVSLQSNNNLIFHETDDDYIISYSKHEMIYKNFILVAINLHPKLSISSRVCIDLKKFGLDTNQSFRAFDLLNNSETIFCDSCYLSLDFDPQLTPAYIFRINQ